MADEEEFTTVWYPYDGGATVGEVGPEGGMVVRDQELGDPDDDEDADARLTLEQGRAARPGWFLTATLYGWMFHTHQAADEADAVAKFTQLTEELTALAGLLPYEDDRDVPGKVRRLTEAVQAFEARYP